MSIFDDIFGTSSYDASAARAKDATNKYARLGAEKQLGAYDKSVAAQRQALAPALTNIGDIYGQEQLGRGDYLGALGIGTPEQQAAAQTAYGNYLQPVNQYGLEDLFRYGGQSGTTASGGTQKALYDYGYTTRFQPWLQALSGFNPLGANAQYGDLASKLSDIEGAYGTNTANVLANKFNTLGASTAGYQNQLAANRSTAAGNTLQGIEWLGNLAGTVAGAALNPAGAAASKASSSLPQYSQLQPNASGSGYSTFPQFV